MDRTSPTLLELLRDGSDQVAWREFLSRYWRPLYLFARGQGLSEQVAEELVQEAVVTVFEKRAFFHYDPRKGRFSNYLFTIIAQRIALRRRIDGRRREVPQEDRDGRDIVQNATMALGPEENFERLFEQNLLASMLDVVRRDVGPATFQAFELVTLHQVNPTDAARLTGLSRNAVYLSKKRVMTRLRELGAPYKDSGKLHALLKGMATDEPPERIHQSLTESVSRSLEGPAAEKSGLA